METLIIRADAGGLLGTGHVMRMLALAQAYKRRGGDVVVASAQCPEDIVERVQELEVKHVFIPAEDLGGSGDVKSTIELCQKLGGKWLVLDGYHFDERYQKSFTGEAMKVLILDDYGHCEKWFADAVLNQNLRADKRGSIDYKSSRIQTLAGASFALLREEFTKGIENAEPSDFPIRNVLVTLGGADPDNVTLKVLKAIEHSGVGGLQIRVLVGGANENKESLEDFAQSSSHGVELLCNVRDMPSMYKWADAVVSAGGSTCWEWLAYGLPGAVVTIAENQEPVVKAMEAEKLALNLGWFTEFDVETWGLKLERFLEGYFDGASYEQRRSVIDGYGADRVASFIDSGVWCKPAQPSDVEMYFEWANDSAVRANAFNTQEIKYASHKQWFDRKLFSNESLLLACYLYDGSPVGQVRFDYHSESRRWYIDYSIDASYRGKGLGGEALKSTISFMVHHRSNEFELAAEVKHDNLASRKIFERLGFTKQPENKQHLLYTLSI